MNGERDSLRPDDHGLFGGTLGEAAPKLVDPGEIADAAAEVPVADPAADPAATVSRSRRALRKLQSGPPSDFEQVIDLLYEWRETNPSIQATDLMRQLLALNHNVQDASAAATLRRLINQAREDKIVAEVKRLGLDRAERLLGLKRNDE